MAVPVTDGPQELWALERRGTDGRWRFLHGAAGPDKAGVERLAEQMRKFEPKSEDGTLRVVRYVKAEVMA